MSHVFSLTMRASGFDNLDVCLHHRLSSRIFIAVIFLVRIFSLVSLVLLTLAKIVHHLFVLPLIAVLHIPYLALLVVLFLIIKPILGPLIHARFRFFNLSPISSPLP